MSVQPDDSTCGPTCLHAVYRYHGDDLPLERVIAEVARLETGGTVAALLGIHALQRGYRATLYTYNLRVFDPSWFGGETVDIGGRLTQQMTVKRDSSIRFMSECYVEYLALGGVVRFEELTPGLIRRYLKRDLPILTGLSATYLYGCPREVFDEDPGFDDVRGEPTGHFVVLSGYDMARREVLVADPLQERPQFESQYYWVSLWRLVGAVFLGALTRDGNLLILEPPLDRKESR
jgi:hypothetical protein